jgi:hypothetical protein
MNSLFVPSIVDGRILNVYWEFRGGGEELMGVGVGGVFADLLPGAGFYDAAALHDGYAVAEIADKGHAVGDEEAGEVVAVLEVAEEIDDLRGYGDVEGADGFVQDQKTWAEGQSAGDVDALALASGELVGVSGEGGGVEVDFGEEGVEAGREAFGWGFVVDAEGFGEDLADRHAGIEGGVGVLEDDGDVAAEAAEVAGWEGEEVYRLRGVRGGVGKGAAGGFDEAEEEAGEGAFSGAGFADEAEGLAAVEVEGDVIEDAVGAVELGEVLRF